MRPTGIRGLAALLVAATVSAGAPPVGSPGSHVYLVATSAHTSGQLGSTWVTDLVIHNPGASAATANLYFLEKGLDNTGAAGIPLEIAAGASVRLPDVVATSFGRTRASGALLVGCDSALVVVSRTFNDAATGTFGQYVEGAPTAEAVRSGETVRLLQLARTANYRTNIGVANATGNALAVQAVLHRADGSVVGTRSLTVPPFGFAQDDDSFAKAGATDVADGYAVVASATPDARYLVYASVIDNRTNDPVCVVPVGRVTPTATSSSRPADGAGSGVRSPGSAAPPPAPVETASSGAAATSTVVVSHLAGTIGGPGSRDGSGSAARLAFPSGIVADAVGNAWIADTANHTLRRLSTAGSATTLAGLAGHPGSAGGSGSTARFWNPSGMTMDGAGNLFVADTDNHAIRKVTPAGVVSTVAGQPGSPGASDGSGSAARFRGPTAIVVNLFGNLLVADTGNHTIRRISPFGAVVTLAGRAGSPGSDNGVGSAARFAGPTGIAADSAGNAWVADTGNHTIRKVSSGGSVTTVAGLSGSSGTLDGFGAAARFAFPAGLAGDGQGGIYLADAGNCTIRRVSSAGAVTTLAGWPGVPGAVDGTGSAARFTAPAAVAATSSAFILVADAGNHLIRRVSSTGAVSTVAGMAPQPGSSDGAAATARFAGPADVAADAQGNVFVADMWNHTIRRVSASGTVSTLAGRAGEPGSSDGSGGSARFRKPSGLAVDAAGVLYLTDRDNHTVRRISSTGSVATVAGRPGYPGSADATTGSGARFSSPDGIAVGPAGTLVVADTGNCTIRTVASDGAVATLAGKAGSCAATDGAGAAARFDHPTGVAVDGAGTVFVADTGNHVIRMVTAAGVATTLAGKAGTPGSDDGVGAAARFTSPSAVALGVGGVLWVAEEQGTVRRIAQGGAVTTVAGLAGAVGSEDGDGALARFNLPEGLAIGGEDSLVLADYDNNAVRRLTFGGCELACSATAAPSEGRAPLAVELAGTASPFGTGCGSVDWIWDYGDGTAPSTGATPTHTYAHGGTFTWTATARTGGLVCSRTGTVVVEPPCGQPPAPTLTAPQTASAGSSYEQSWTATSPDSTYELQESTDPTFAGAASRSVGGTATTTSHEATTTTTWYARCRATATCGGSSYTSEWSATATTIVVPGPAPGAAVFLPAAAHVLGLASTFWVTDLEVHNPGTTQAGFVLALLRAGEDNTAPRTATFSLDPGENLRLPDVLWAALPGFGFPGSATMRITPTAGSVMATQRTYNDQPAGTFGQFIPGLPASSAVTTGQEARLVGLSESADTTVGFRTNLGLASVTAKPVTITFALHRGDGFSLGEQTRTLLPYGFLQIANVFNLVSTSGIAEGFIVLHSDTPETAFFAYASVVDNRSGDPIYIPARVVAP